MYNYLHEDTTYTVRFTELVSINYWNLIKTVWAVFKKMAILCFGAHLKLKCSYPPDTDLWQTHSWMLWIKLVEPFRHKQRAHPFIHTYRQRYIKNYFFLFRGLKICKSVNIFKTDFFTFTVTSHIYYMHERVKRVKLCGKNSVIQEKEWLGLLRIV
jgi:hypothetical protein